MNLLSHIKLLSRHAIVAIIPVVVFLSVSCVSASPSSKQLVGGPCTYKLYAGKAQIVSVSQKQDNPAAFEIKFSFHPKKAIQEEYARVTGKQWSLVMNDFSDPPETFVKKYSIKPGKRFPCNMKVITKGTCSPVIFDFPTLDRDRAQ